MMSQITKGGRGGTLIGDVERRKKRKETMRVSKGEREKVWGGGGCPLTPLKNDGSYLLPTKKPGGV